MEYYPLETEEDRDKAIKRLLELERDNIENKKLLEEISDELIMAMHINAELPPDWRDRTKSLQQRIDACQKECDSIIRTNKDSLN